MDRLAEEIRRHGQRDVQELASGVSNVNLEGIQTNYVQNEGSNNSMFIDGVHYHGNTEHSAYQSCIQTLRFPDPSKVKTKLLESKDRLLKTAIEWVTKEDAYRLLMQDEDTGLLWIKGGAGKGKTMMSIGLIERLVDFTGSSMTTFFFCQNADHDLNTAENVLKGLIRRLADQREDLQAPLSNFWQARGKANGQADIDLDDLWNVFLAMLEKCELVYILIDALDECKGDGMGKLLRKLVRSGLNRSSRLKWILTSRPFSVGETNLLAGDAQLGINLDLNTEHLTEAVEVYVAFKVEELRKEHHYSEALSDNIKTKLLEKAEGTFLWVKMVCQTLENADSNALSIIDTTPPSLHAFFAQSLQRLCDLENASDCVKLLQTMLLVFRPLKLAEIESVTGLSQRTVFEERIVENCASFLTYSDGSIVFVHKSARDYLAGEGSALLDAYGPESNSEIVMRSLNFLLANAKVNLLDLAYPDSYARPVEDRTYDVETLDELTYAATFWSQHLKAIDTKRAGFQASEISEMLSAFLRHRVLEWLECLVLLRLLPTAIDALQVVLHHLEKTPASDNADVLGIVSDAIELVSRYVTDRQVYPLQIYSSALAFSPDSSVIKQLNTDKMASWLVKIPQIQGQWPIVRFTVQHKVPVGKSTTEMGELRSVCFSPNAETIMSTDHNAQRMLFATATGQLRKIVKVECEEGMGRMTEIFKTIPQESQRLLRDAKFSCFSGYSPDGKTIALSCKESHCVKLVDADTYALRITLPTHHSPSYRSVVFLPNRDLIAAGCLDQTIKLWSTTTAECVKTLGPYHLSPILSVDIHPCSDLLVVGYYSGTVELRQFEDDYDPLIVVAAALRRCDNPWVDEIVQQTAFSPTGELLAVVRSRSLIVYNVLTRKLYRTIALHRECHGGTTIKFCNRGEQLLVAGEGSEVEIYDIDSTNLVMTMNDHAHNFVGRDRDASYFPTSDAPGWGFKPQTMGTIIRCASVARDGKLVVSCSIDGTLKLWTLPGQEQQDVRAHMQKVGAVCTSRNGKIVAIAHEHLIQIQALEGSTVSVDLHDHAGPNAGGAIVRSLALSHNAKLLTCSTAWEVYLFDVQTGDAISRQRWGSEPYQPQTTITGAFSYCDRFIAYAYGRLLLEPWRHSLDVTLLDIDLHVLYRFNIEEDPYRVTPENPSFTSVTFSMALAFSPTDDRLALLLSTGELWVVNIERYCFGDFKEFFRWLPDLTGFRSPMLIEDYIRYQEAEMRFTADGDSLITSLGSIYVNQERLKAGEKAPRRWLPAFSEDNWVVYGPQRILKIPDHLRVSARAIHDGHIVLGCHDGTVLTLEIDLEQLVPGYSEFAA